MEVDYLNDELREDSLFHERQAVVDSVDEKIHHLWQRLRTASRTA